MEDPMIAWNLRKLDIIAFIFIFINLVILASFFSRKSQTFLALTVVTSAIIFFLLMVTRNEYGLGF